MTPIAPHISAFLQQRLPMERGASENTCDSYSYAFQLLFIYASGRFKIEPSALLFEQMDAPLVVDFLNHLETDRGNSPVSRNLRLAAVKSFMRYMQYRLPAALEQIQRVLAIPPKRTDIRLVHHLTRDEMQAILDAPDPATRFGIRDRAMLHLCFCAGLRVSELVTLCLADLNVQPKATILIHGKGRRERALPLWRDTTRAVRAWLTLRRESPFPQLFLNSQGEPMTRAGFEYILQKHAATASKQCPSLLQKRVSPHVLRHTCAMTVLTATKDIRKVSLWLGHATIQTTEMYLRADATEKCETIELITPPRLRAGRFRATDKLLASLKVSTLCGVQSRKSGHNQR
ncbi:MAG: tyrosine-type recombinase/integrase [Chloroflexota bacterium]